MPKSNRKTIAAKFDIGDRLNSVSLLASEVCFLADAVDSDITNGPARGDSRDNRRLGLIVAGTMTLANKADELREALIQMEADYTASLKAVRQ